MRDPQTLLDQKPVALQLGVAEVTLEKWRQEGRGPAFIKIGRLVRYRQSDIDSWLNAQTVSGDVA